MEVIEPAWRVGFAADVGAEREGGDLAELAVGFEATAVCLAGTGVRLTPSDNEARGLVTADLNDDPEPTGEGTDPRAAAATEPPADAAGFELVEDDSGAFADVVGCGLEGTTEARLLGTAAAGVGRVAVAVLVLLPGVTVGFLKADTEEDVGAGFLEAAEVSGLDGGDLTAPDPKVPELSTRFTTGDEGPPFSLPGVPDILNLSLDGAAWRGSTGFTSSAVLLSGSG